MKYTTENIARILQETREKRGLSQRELSVASGVPQSHISKIEQGAVDLRLSSLIELARTLDLELTLVPRQAMPAVQSIVRSTTPSSTGGRETRQAHKELSNLGKVVDEHRSALSLKPEELAQLQRQLRELWHFSLSDSDRKTIREADQTIKAYLHDKNNVNTVRQAFAHLKEMRNALAHGSAHPTQQAEPVRPAYSLDEDENA